MSFHTFQGRENASEKLTSQVSHSPGNSKSSASSRETLDDIERASIQDHTNAHNADEKSAHSVSLELRRTTTKASNILERVFTTRSIVDPPPPPDGGLKAWTMVACGWIVIFTTWGWVNSYGAFQAYYSLHLDESASTISWIGTIQNWLTFIIGAFSGRALDAGLYIPCLLVGCTLQVLGIFLMSISTKYWQLMLTQGVLTGIGGGIFFTPSLGLVATYFSKRRSLATGLSTTGNAVGGAIYPLIVKELLPRIGFAWTVRVLGFLNLGLLAIVIAFMRPRLPPRKSGPLIDLSGFREPPYAFFVACLFFAIWPIYYTFYYIASYGTETLGLSYSASTILIIILNGVGVPARIIFPYFADKTGQLNLLVPTLACLTVVAYCWLAVDSVGGLYAFTCVYGFINASFQCLMPSTVASITPDLNMVGTRLGMAFSVLSLAALTGPPIGGALQSAMGGNFTGAMVFAATSTLVSAFFVVATRVAKVGWRVKVRC